ncbi:hypothetical protein [Burkholderia sp. Ac-20379]|uniref:hypothetical protein n=1 Tax=Burkholderia sp. Ac-20379 TaxID=2703900 RepID=UPI001981D0C6|nr:hypothetical protein [Burkholderia sp. Ac-20379]MBN3728218.1 hypothetical protein [Burkholderia sp. Ac-20379]
MKRLFIAAMTIAALSGCAHTITISTDTKALAVTPAVEQIDKSVGLIVTDEMRQRDVTTPGGGGDKVTYKPYRDLEFPIYLALTRTFKNVERLSTEPDAASARAKGLSYLIKPRIVTTSSSQSALTWPPTDFSVTLVCTISDLDGKTIGKAEVSGHGHAEYSEFKHQLGLAADRASLDAAAKLPAAIRQAIEGQQAPQ